MISLSVTACVELKYDDSSMISIDCTAVENELDASMLQRGELDWLIYNKPLEYADLILNGGIEDYIKRNAGASVNSKRQRGRRIK